METQNKIKQFTTENLNCLIGKNKIETQILRCTIEVPILKQYKVGFAYKLNNQFWKVKTIYGVFQIPDTNIIKHNFINCNKANW